MNQESQSQERKICRSCFRDLPVNYFGILMSMPDRYNYTCKECRNYRRRKAYGKTTPSEAVPPLKDHNQKVFDSLQEQQLPVVLKSIQLPTESQIEVSFDRDELNGIKVSIYKDGFALQLLQFSDSQINAIRPLLMDLLFEMKIRLAPTSFY